MRFTSLLAMVSLLALLAGCGEKRMEWAHKAAESDGPIPAAAWKRLAGRRIYFGHMSVGTNIVAGLGDLSAENPDARLNIVETRRPAEISGVAFAHGPIGRNGDPISKIEAFVAAMDAAAGGMDIGIFKFCFVDITAGTDVPAVFAAYREAMAGLRRRWPRLAIVHATVPLTTVQGGLKGRLKRWAGIAPDGYRDNLARAEYNDLIRSAYAGREPVFDLAAAESRRPSGEMTGFSYGGRKGQALAPEYSADGGHLNRPGRRRAALRLLEILGGLQPTP